MQDVAYIYIHYFFSCMCVCVCKEGASGATAARPPASLCEDRVITIIINRVITIIINIQVKSSTLCQRCRVSVFPRSVSLYIRFINLSSPSFFFSFYLSIISSVMYER